MEAVRIGGRAREDAADNGGLGGRHRQGEGEEEAPKARCINVASGRGDRGNRWILADDNNVPPPPGPMAPRGEGRQGGVRRRHAIGRPSRSGDGSAHDDVLSPPIQCLEDNGTPSGPRDGGGPCCVINGAFKGVGRGTNLTMKEGVGGEW
jgi:hypothetical protein